MNERRTVCPAPGCTYTNSVSSVAAHVSGKTDSSHDWQSLGYRGANHYKQNKSQLEGQESVTKIGWLTDSHIGKKTGGYGNSEWDIFPVEQLNDAVRLLSTVDLDTVVYTGDLFHEDSSGVDEQNIESVKEIFGSHLPGVLPIRYIKGNHAKEQGKRIWSHLENEGIAEPLTGYPHEINETAIYGVDHYYDDSEWLNTVPDLRSTHSDYKILCLHQSVEEIEERLSGLSAEELPDLILLGHPHAVIDKKIEVDDKLIQVLCYGSTTRVGNKREEYPPGAALIISGPMFSQIGYLSTEIP